MKDFWVGIMKKIYKNVLILLMFGGIGFYFRVPIQNIWIQLQGQYLPCRNPIAYSLGSYDNRFGISKDDFLIALVAAENVWEKPIGKNLFVYKPTGNLKINLIYDIRQEATIKLKQMGIVVETSRTSYNALKLKYDTLFLDYKNQKISFEAKIAVLNSRKRAYEIEVSGTNKKGGADKETFARLNTEKELLDQEIISINQLQVILNNTATEVNALVIFLNQLATTLNIDVKRFNTVGSTLGEEFDEGVYKTGPDGQEIDIYQFENRTKLIRVLAHELGHALGLDHVEDPKAIMYRLNNGVNEKPTATDLAILKKLCSIK